MRKFALATAALIGGATLALQPVFAEPTPLAKTVPQVKQLRVVIDAGHGGVDKGAASINIVEKDVTLSMARKLKSELEQRNIQVVMTRVDDKFLSLHDRVRIAEKAKADYFVSFHAQEPGKFASTYELSYKHSSSKALASVVNDQILRRVGVTASEHRRAIQQRNYYVLREVSIPAVMISGDLKAFAEVESQDKLVHAVARGLLSLSKTDAKK